MPYSVAELEKRVEQRPDSEGMQMAVDRASNPVIDHTYRPYIAGESLFDKLVADYKNERITPGDVVLAYGLARDFTHDAWQDFFTLADEAKVGDAVVTYEHGTSFGHKGIRTYFDPLMSGRLDAPVGLATDEQFWLKPLVKFEGRTMYVSPQKRITVGDAAVQALYEPALGHRKGIWLENPPDLFARRADNTLVMNRLGLIAGNSAFEKERDEVIDTLQVSCMPKKWTREHVLIVAKLLPRLAALEPELAEDVIDCVAKTQDGLDDRIVEAVARTIAQKEGVVYEDFDDTTRQGRVQQLRLHSLATLRVIDAMS